MKEIRRNTMQENKFCCHCDSLLLLLFQCIVKKSTYNHSFSLFGVLFLRRHGEIGRENQPITAINLQQKFYGTYKLYLYTYIWYRMKYII